MWSICTMKIYVTIKRNEELTHDTTWMDLENIMQSEKSHSQKTTYCMTPII